MRTKLLLGAVCALFLSSVCVFAQEEKATDLFAKRNFDLWDFHFAAEEGKAPVRGEEIFSFTGDGVLDCKGEPFGYIVTKSIYKNFRMSVEYAWPEGVEPTNSGVFLRVNAQPKDHFLPRGIEVQLQHSNAGDLWAFHGMKFDGPKGERFKGNGVKKLEAAEKPPGQWNRVEIFAYDALIVVILNGKVVNWTSQAEQLPGKVGLQSEGGPIKFRNCIIEKLP